MSQASFILEEYKRSVKKFIKDTKSWNALDAYKHYTAIYEDWEETSDNANGGFDVSWSFHKKDLTDKEIAIKFYELLIQELQTCIDNEVEHIESIEIFYK